MATRLLSEQVKCFKLRMAGVLPGSVDCANADDPAFPGAVQVQAAADRLLAGAQRGCLFAQSAQTNGYLFCPAPCDGVVPSIGDYNGVARCLACLVKPRTRAAIATAYGNAGTPSSIAQRCQTGIGKAMTKQAKAQLKEQQLCQLTEDLHPVGANCRIADPKGKVAKALAKVNVQIDRCGTPTNLFPQLTSCGSDSASEKSCIKAALDLQNDAIFEDVYDPIGLDGVFVSSSLGTPGMK